MQEYKPCDSTGNHGSGEGVGERDRAATELRTRRYKIVLGGPEAMYSQGPQNREAEGLGQRHWKSLGCGLCSKRVARAKGRGRL